MQKSQRSAGCPWLFSTGCIVSLEQLNFSSARVVYPVCSRIICWLWSFYCLCCHCTLRISEQCTLDCFRRGFCIIPNAPWQSALSQLRCVGSTGGISAAVVKFGIQAHLQPQIFIYTALHGTGICWDGGCCPEMNQSKDLSPKVTSKFFTDLENHVITHVL